MASPNPIVTVPLKDDQVVKLELVDIFTENGVTWHQIPPEEFIDKVLPIWEEVNIPTKCLIFLPCKFFFVVNATKIICFSMFDKDSSFLQADLSAIYIIAYNRELISLHQSGTTTGEDLDCELDSTPSDNEKIDQVFIPRLSIPLPSRIIEPAQEALAEDKILCELLYDEDNHPITDEDTIVAAVGVEVDAVDILQIYQDMTFEDGDFWIKGQFLYLYVDPDLGYWTNIKLKHGLEVEVFIVVDLDYEKEEVEHIISVLYSWGKVDFEFEHIKGSPFV